MAKVVKFGGSSLADANQFRKVAEIIRSDKERRYVVPSAPGKRSSGDTKVTDMLYKCYDDVSKGANAVSSTLAPEKKMIACSVPGPSKQNPLLRAVTVTELPLTR